jgi:peptidoglycan hydrolase-like protein with peptidoglycan-binding domain
MTTMYSIQIYNAPNTSSVKVQVINKELGEIAQHTLTTNLPLDTQGLNFFASRTMGAPLTNSGQFDLGLLGVYSI